MIGQVTPDYRERLLARVDLVEIVGQRVQLRKSGKEYQARCPFHNEKTPSFTVSAEKQFYHCFGCGAHGNAIDFLLEHDRLSFPEAIEELARQAGMELPDAGIAMEKGPDPSPLYAVLEQAADLYRRQFREHPQAGEAIAYLKRRGLSGEIARRFGLGYAPAGWNFLRSHLRTQPDHPNDDATLVDAGLLTDRDGKRYDRFRHRLMFPIRDRRGRVVGFGGRVLDNGEPKYLNSPETAVFHKGRELYGLYEAQQAERAPPRVLVVEGYMDVIALAQFGIPYAVATLGTATTTDHVKRLLRVAPELVFCFDGDRAGRAAAWKALKTALPLATGERPVRFLFLPDGEDPDSLIRKEGCAAFEARLSHAALLSDVLFQHLTGPLDLNTAEGRAALDAQARALLDDMPAGTFRALLEARLVELVGFDASAQPRTTPAREQASPPASRTRADAQGRPRRRRHMPAQAGQPVATTPLRRAIAMLLHDPALAPRARELPADWQEIDNPGIALLRELLDMIAADPEITPAALRARWDGTEQEKIIARLSDSALIDHIPADGRAAEFVGALARLNTDAAQERRQRALRAQRPAS
ncbi:DNA primase [Thiohalocapsa marina]|uniref:DNA primase n=1 Tax=Thiohalocapsa marina TaxID=424902 RepID=A0A5M8FHY8_9GAMM|nr:DNA primase [Thiohalocapsa marina]KAA6183570.1 DNA primase [Thiohalocapsa marina]